MAIDLFCYTSKSMPIILSLNAELLANEALFFENKFYFNNPKPIEYFDNECLKQSNYQAKNFFLVSLIDKNEADKIQQVAELIFG